VASRIDSESGFEMVPLVLVPRIPVALERFIRRRTRGMNYGSMVENNATIGIYTGLLTNKFSGFV